MEPAFAAAGGDDVLSDVVLRVARELRALEGRAAGVDDAVGALLQGEAAISPGQSRHLQYLDLLCQSLECLAQFLENTAGGLDPDWRCDSHLAAEALPLRELAARLSASEVESGSSQPAGEGVCIFC